MLGQRTEIIMARRTILLTLCIALALLAGVRCVESQYNYLLHGYYVRPHDAPPSNESLPCHIAVRSRAEKPAKVGSRPKQRGMGSLQDQRGRCKELPAGLQHTCRRYDHEQLSRQDFSRLSLVLAPSCRS